MHNQFANCSIISNALNSQGHLMYCDRMFFDVNLYRAIIPTHLSQVACNYNEIFNLSKPNTVSDWISYQIN